MKKQNRAKWANAPAGCTHYNPTGNGTFEKIDMLPGGGGGILYTWVDGLKEYKRCGLLDSNSIKKRVARR